MKPKTRIWLCPKDQLMEGSYMRAEVIYQEEPASIVVFRYKDNCLAFLNQCVHMPRRLDCEKDMIFDETGQNLRCSMHGIIYDPVTGESLSAICKGDKLTRIKVQENEAGVWILDKRVKPLLEQVTD